MNPTETGEFVDPSPSGSDSLIGTMVGSYRILKMLGSGGMGDVYLALDTRLERRVALKFLQTRFTADSERVRRFRQEARAASALNHPNILTIHELDGSFGDDHEIVRWRYQRLRPPHR